MFFKIIIIALSLILGACFVAPSHAQYLTLLGPQSAEDVSQSYFIALLDKALSQQGPNPYKFNVTNELGPTQGRTVQLLSSGLIDVFWMGTSVDREKKFKAIKIPLFKGLLGYRVSIIHRQQVSRFDSLNESQFRKLIACQGEHWPDTQILLHNQYEVMPIARFELMFDMVDRGRCDYFPRAIFEGYGELEKAQARLPELTIYDNVILHYPFPIYFFVDKSRAELAAKIESGLEAMIDSGEHEALMKRHPMTRHLFPIEQWQNKTIFRLDNPFLDRKIDLTQERYWFQL